jgi:deazaflavin-dependent oxidoreductase (nitroreductase family)
MSENEERVARNAGIIEQFRANGGAVPGYEETPLLLLTTTGAKSGQARLSPVAYLADADRFVVFAANGGRDHDPAWCRNLVADPHVTVELEGGRRFAAVARVATGDERDQLWARGLAALPMFEQFRTATDRLIPVVVLDPAAPPA